MREYCKMYRKCIHGNLFPVFRNVVTKEKFSRETSSFKAEEFEGCVCMHVGTLTGRVYISGRVLLKKDNV